MKRISIAAARAAAIAVLACAAAAPAAALGTDMNSDEQWACEVAMCMSNPSGPTAVAECAAPIKKMYRELAKGHVIPGCKFLGGDTGRDPGNGTGGGDSPGGRQPVEQIR